MYGKIQNVPNHQPLVDCWHKIHQPRIKSAVVSVDKALMWVVSPESFWTSIPHKSTNSVCQPRIWEPISSTKCSLNFMELFNIVHMLSTFVSIFSPKKTYPLKVLERFNPAKTGYSWLWNPWWRLGSPMTFSNPPIRKKGQKAPKSHIFW